MAFVLPGGVNEPPVTASAAMMVVSGSDRAMRRSHDGVWRRRRRRRLRTEPAAEAGYQDQQHTDNRPSDIQRSHTSESMNARIPVNQRSRSLDSRL